MVKNCRWLSVQSAVTVVREWSKARGREMCSVHEYSSSPGVRELMIREHRLLSVVFIRCVSLGCLGATLHACVSAGDARVDLNQDEVGMDKSGSGVSYPNVGMECFTLQRVNRRALCVRVRGVFRESQNLILDVVESNQGVETASECHAAFEEADDGTYVHRGVQLPSVGGRTIGLVNGIPLGQRGEFPVWEREDNSAFTAQVVVLRESIYRDTSLSDDAHAEWVIMASFVGGARRFIGTRFVTKTTYLPTDPTESWCRLTTPRAGPPQT